MILQALRRSRYEPIEHFKTIDDPVVYGRGFADLTRATKGVIRKNAGKMPAVDIADAMGWTLRRLQRVARADGIDLRYPRQPEPEPRGS
jgi:hypothetical protein